MRTTSVEQGGAMCLVAAVASLMRGKRYIHDVKETQAQ